MPDDDDDAMPGRRRGRRPMDQEGGWDQAMRGSGASRSLSWLRRTRDLIRTFGEQGAADRLGVTRRTVRAWQSPDRSRRREPSAANRGRLVDAHRSSEVRQTVTRRRGSAFRSRGMSILWVGQAGPTIGGTAYLRHRRMQISLSAAASSRVMDAYERGGADAAQAQMGRELDSQMPISGHRGGASWSFGSATEFTIGRGSGARPDDDDADDE